MLLSHDRIMQCCKKIATLYYGNFIISINIMFPISRGVVEKEITYNKGIQINTMFMRHKLKIEY